MQLQKLSAKGSTKSGCGLIVMQCLRQWLAGCKADQLVIAPCTYVQVLWPMLSIM